MESIRVRTEWEGEIKNEGNMVISLMKNMLKGSKKQRAEWRNYVALKGSQVRREIKFTLQWIWEWLHIYLQCFFLVEATGVIK